jgi:hypothetical protein
MLGGVIHLKSAPAATSKRTLRGMVEGQKGARLLLHFSGYQHRTTIKVTLGTHTNSSASQKGQAERDGVIGA